MLPSRLPGIAEQLQELPELPVRLQDLTISSSFSWTWWKSQCSQTSFAICQVPSAWGPGQQIQPRVGYFQKIRDTSWKLYWGNVISMRNWGGTPLSIIMANPVLFWGLSKRLNEAQLCKNTCFPQPNFWKTLPLSPLPSHPCCWSHRCLVVEPKAFPLEFSPSFVLRRRVTPKFSSERWWVRILGHQARHKYWTMDSVYHLLSVLSICFTSDCKRSRCAYWPETMSWECLKKTTLNIKGRFIV